MSKRKQCSFQMLEMKILVCLNTFCIQICWFLIACHFTNPISEGANIKCMEKATLRNPLPELAILIIGFFYSWKHFA